MSLGLKGLKQETYFEWYSFYSLRYQGSLQKQWKKHHNNSFVTVKIRNQLRDLLERKYTIVKKSYTTFE